MSFIWIWLSTDWPLSGIQFSARYQPNLWNCILLSLNGFLSGGILDLHIPLKSAHFFCAVSPQNLVGHSSFFSTERVCVSFLLFHSPIKSVQSFISCCAVVARNSTFRSKSFHVEERTNTEKKPKAVEWILFSQGLNRFYWMLWILWNILWIEFEVTYLKWFDESFKTQREKINVSLPIADEGYLRLSSKLCAFK